MTCAPSRVGSSLKIYWMKTSEAFPGDSWLETQFTCFDEAKPDRQSDSRWHASIGNVHQVPAGPEGGLWAWSMTTVLPSPRFPFPISGKKSSRGDARRRVIECYKRMLKFDGRR